LVGRLQTVAVIIWGICACGVGYVLNDLIRRLLWRRRQPFSPHLPFRRMDAADQLRTVMGASFSTKRVMSLGEYQTFKEVEAEAAACNGGYRVFAQTSLGEVIRSKDGQAHSAINSKRVDILVIGYDGLPVLAVEFQGGGHYQFDAAARDAVKKEALRRAGVAYLEVFDGETPAEIRTRVRAVLGRRVAA